MIPELGVWSIFLIPVVSFVIISFIIRPFFNKYSKTAGHLTISAISVSFLLSIWTLNSVVSTGHPLDFASKSWIAIGEFELAIGLMVDSLTAIMLVIVTGVSLMVQIYSQGYMDRDPGYARYFAYMSLFTASMVGLVISSNILQLYVFWELVGLCSYLLIGFWYHRASAAKAAKKAFLVTRLGDFGFLIAIIYLFVNGLPLDIDSLHGQIAAGTIAGVSITWLTIGIFAGAIGKSAQFPLHTWLPDAMEGPTPVSALIHAATMVTAGVFLIARFFPLFQSSTETMTIVALVGGGTALFAATMALVAHDIKKVLAYSTISQLGFMIAALGVGAYGAAMFHLFTHAFFKALLFLGAGSVNHATGTFDMRYMGGLRRYMPWTYFLVLIAALSLSGIFPLSGFWSKDEVLMGAWIGTSVISNITFYLLIISVFLTSFYAFRMIYMTFHGEFRGPAPDSKEKSNIDSTHDSHHNHMVESPMVMIIPMVFLGIASIVAGYVVNPQASIFGITSHWFSEFVVPPSTHPGHVLPINIGLASISMIISLSGIGLATMMYQFKIIPHNIPGKLFKGVYRLLYERYYMDFIYENLLVIRLLYGKIAFLADWVDRSTIDGAVDSIGWFSRNVGIGLRHVQTGQVQTYGVIASLGVVLLVAIYIIWNPGIN